MRRVLLGTTALIGALALGTGFAAPALAGPPPIPVTVYGEANNGICVQVSSLDPLCIDLGQP